MNKKYLSVILFGALVLGTAGTFTSCKDYDDDIANLQEQIDKKASVEELQSKIAALQQDVSAAKTAAEDAKNKAQEALNEAQKAADKAQDAADKAQDALDKASGAGSGDVTSAELQALKNELQAQIDKLASLEEVEKKLNALEEKLKGEFPTDKELADLAAEVDTLSAEVMALIGHRLTSLSVIPTTHVNGIAAITLTTLQYTPQKYVAKDHPSGHTTDPWLDHTDNGTARYISTDNNVAYFHVSPNMGVRTEDIETPIFDCIQSENIVTKAGGVAVKENSPIEPVSYNIDNNVLTVNFKKTITDFIGKTDVDASKETFYMASLKAPIAENNLTPGEKESIENGDVDGVYVNSEYVRLEELIKVPYLVNTRTDFTKAMTGSFANETQTDAEGTFYVHYYDSACVYHSEANDLVDVKCAYDEALDLKKLVKVCVTDEGATDHTAHADLPNYKEYGLSFRFYLATAPYITLGGPEGNSNRTDQQKFAEIDNPTNGIMTSKVYTVGEGGESATAVGREPIVRIELRDTVNNALVAQRYVKIKWARETGERAITHNLADSIYVCGNYQGRLGTQTMNEVIYAGAKDGGMTKREFHAVYTDGGFDGTSGAGEGVVEIVKNTEDGVDSYNLKWTLTHADIVTKYPVWENQETMTFSKVCYWKDPIGAYPTLKITLTRTIYKPVFNVWGYDGRYWKDNGNWNVFNVNPIVYNTQESNPAWSNNTTNNPTCNIYTDLLNGFLDDMGVKPTIGASGAIYFTDKEREGLKFYYSKEYPTATSGFKGVDRTTDTYAAYSNEGVRFVFDAEKLEAPNTEYVYQYFNGTNVVDMTATVSSDGTVLYIDGKKAAEIVNYQPNQLNSSEMTYNIRLEENNPTHAPYSGDTPTEAAKAIVGKNVPIKLVADLCYNDGCATAPVLAPAHTQTIKEYDAFIIEPLTVREGDTEDFTDATIGGSTIDVQGAFTYISWNKNAQGQNYVVANTSGLAKDLWEFYEGVEEEWMTDNITSNLQLDANGNLVPTEGVTNGPVPSNTKITYDGTDETLTYYNYSGTPVNRDYKLFIPVKFGYKWKTFTRTFTVDVKANAGTPTRAL